MRRALFMWILRSFFYRRSRPAGFEKNGRVSSRFFLRRSKSSKCLKFKGMLLVKKEAVSGRRVYSLAVWRYWGGAMFQGG